MFKTEPFVPSEVRLDLHSHSRHSPDSRLDPKEMVRVARSRGLDGLAITDHNAVEGSKSAWEQVRDDDFLVIRGVEVSTRDGHVLAYGVDAAPARDQGVVETVEEVARLGGIAVAAHPYRFWSGLGEDRTVAATFPAYETLNARTSPRGNGRAAALARAKGVGGTGGSDAHFLDELGRSATVFPDASSEAEVLEALAKGRSSPKGSHRRGRATVRYVTKCVSEWMLRGMKRI